VSQYPRWRYYPPREEPPPWVHALVKVFEAAQAAIDSHTVQGLQSDGVLAQVRGGLEALGYQVEAGKERRHRIVRPVLFGDQGRPRVNYEVDAVDDSEGVLLEVEAGRAMLGNAVYRDLVRTSLIVGARYLALCVMSEYKYNSGKKVLTSRDFDAAGDQLDAVYASGRLALPFDGVLLLGY
jgi:hypothetical protein